MNAIAVESVQSWHDRPIHMQSRENRNISVQSAIKPNLTADRQVWAQTGGQAQTCALGSHAILSVPRNPQKGLFRIFTILPQSGPRYLQSGRLRLDCGIKVILRQSSKLFQSHIKLHVVRFKTKHWPWSFHNHNNSIQLCADCRSYTWLTGLQGDPPGCIRIGRIAEHINHAM